MHVVTASPTLPYRPLTTTTPVDKALEFGMSGKDHVFNRYATAHQRSVYKDSGHLCPSLFQPGPGHSPRTSTYSGRCNESCSVPSEQIPATSYSAKPTYNQVSIGETRGVFGRVTDPPHAHTFPPGMLFLYQLREPYQQPPIQQWRMMLSLPPAVCGPD